jgi:glycosyltransferase involved in cell wall biosynthesis
MANAASRPLRIGLVTPAWPGTRTPNGIATAVSHLTSGLEGLGHQVVILAHKIDAPHDHPRVVPLPDFSVSLLDRLRRRIDLDGWLADTNARRHAQAIRTAADLHGLDIVVMEETQGWVGMVRRLSPVPVVATLHGPWWLHRASGSAPDDASSAAREEREASGLRQVDGITAPSQDVLIRTQALWGLKTDRVAVIGNPVPVPPKGLDLTDALATRILFVGRFDHIKGGDVVLDAFARIAAVDPTCKFTFAGPDVGVPAKEGVLRLADRLALLPASVRDRITATGQQSRDQITALRDRHGITVVASRYETFGGTLVEAMAVGSAVVCTRVGGCQEIVTEGQTGLLVPSEDADAMANACLRLMRDPAMARRLGAAARAHVAAAYAPEVIAQRMADFLTPICRRI